MEDRDYYAMIETNYCGFADNGWADGYADKSSDHVELIKQLYGKIKYLDLVGYLDEYLQGYEVGKWMSENADQIYDEDGMIRSCEYSMDTTSQISQAKFLISDYVDKLSQEKCEP